MAFILVSGVALLFGHKLFVSDRYVQEDSSLSESDVFALLSFIDFLICHYN